MLVKIFKYLGSGEKLLQRFRDICQLEETERAIQIPCEIPSHCNKRELTCKAKFVSNKISY